MGYYSEYINRNMTFQDIVNERKYQLKRISELRGGRDILVYASDLSRNAPTSIDYSDLLPFSDQLSNLHGDCIDIILETPGGTAEVVEDLVKLIRKKYEKVGIIVPGYAKSAGTIFAMAGDEILMGNTSALGPIDAQIASNGKRFSADAFLQGLDKIKGELENATKLNPAYIPILQNISPGEIQHCENAQNFSQKLVSEWLAKYKFKFWEIHSSSGKPVTEEDKIIRAKDIAKVLCDHSYWLTHGRSIKISNFENMKLKITNYSNMLELNEAIMKYYTLLRMSFDASIYKIFETCDSQIYRIIQNSPTNIPSNIPNYATIQYECSNCHNKYNIQANLVSGIPLQQNLLPYPIDDNIFRCPTCGTENNLLQFRLQIEALSGKIITK